MIVWGGAEAGELAVNTGAAYDPITDTWSPLNPAGAPSARFGHTAVWTGTNMVVWGGSPGGGESCGPYCVLGDGAHYSPESDSPAGRIDHSLVWTGNTLIVWGGLRFDRQPRDRWFWQVLDDGGFYDPSRNQWSPVTRTGAPSARSEHSTVWTGTEMIVWGGWYYDTIRSETFNTGGRYNPSTNTWSPVTTTGAPSARRGHTAVWTGTEMIVWAGYFYVDDGIRRSLRSGARYSPANNTWTPMTTANSPPLSRAAVWNGQSMVVSGPTGADKVHAYVPFSEVSFQITRIVHVNDTATLEFPSLPGRTYTLWSADNMTRDSWTNTGLPALSGTGGTLSFLVPATTPVDRFFRIQASP